MNADYFARIDLDRSRFDYECNHWHVSVIKRSDWSTCRALSLLALDSAINRLTGSSNDNGNRHIDDWSSVPTPSLNPWQFTYTQSDIQHTVLIHWTIWLTAYIGPLILTKSIQFKLFNSIQIHPSIHPSVRPSINQSISGLHHVILSGISYSWTS